MNFKNLTKGIMASLIGVVMLASCGGDNPPVNPPAANLGNGVALVGNCVKSDMSAAVLSWTSGQPVTYTAVTKLTATKIGANGNKHIVGVRAYIPNDGSGLTVFAGSDYQNPEVTKSAEWQAAGWQYVMFDTPLEIKGSDYYIGFTVSSTSLAVEETRSTSNDLIQVDGEWMSLKDMVGANAFWAVQAIVAGGDYSKKTQVDMATDFISIDKVWAMNGETVKGEAIVRNNGIKTIKGFTLEAKVGSSVVPVSVPDSLMNGQSLILNFEVPVKGDGGQNVEVSVKAEGDNSTKNNTLTNYIRVYADKGVPRNAVLLEQFTSQQCGWCPNGARGLQASIDAMENPEKLAWVAHHKGFADDDFTIKESAAVTNGMGVKSAPAGSLNRMLMDLDGKGPALNWILGLPTTSILNQLANEPGQSTLTLTRSYSADNDSITVTVSGKSMMETNYVTVIVIQNGLVAKQADYTTQTGVVSNYVHNKVPRMYMTADAGDQVETDAEGNFSITVKDKLPKKVGNFDVKPEDVEIVAIVHGNLNDSDKAKRFVYNADKVSLTENPASVIFSAPEYDYQNGLVPAKAMSVQ